MRGRNWKGVGRDKIGGKGRKGTVGRGRGRERKEGIGKYFSGMWPD